MMCCDEPGGGMESHCSYSKEGRQDAMMVVDDFLKDDWEVALAQQRSFTPKGEALDESPAAGLGPRKSRAARHG